MRSERIWLLALATALLPIFSVHLTYLVSALEGNVPWCNPYWESCTSISATGRYGTAFYLFKGLMLPAAALLAAFWWQQQHWLISLGDAAGPARVVAGLGIIAAVFLIIYTLALGASGDMMRLQRRIGIIIYFTFTYLSQLLSLWRLLKLGHADLRLLQLQRLNLSWILVVGLISLFLSWTLEQYDELEDAFEWVLALFIHVHFVLIGLAWKRSRPA